MTFLSARRAVPALVSAVALVALALPAVASAKVEPKPDINEQCSGSPKIEAEGSTFQGPAQFVLTGYNWETKAFLTTGYNHATNPFACNGEAGTTEHPRTTQKPEVQYNQTNPLERGSGSCLKSFGEGVATFEEEKEEVSGGITYKDKYPRMSRFPFCGTDEAPSATHKAEMEAFAESPSPIETIPFGQGAEAIIVHLPAKCTSSSEPTVKGVTKVSGRLSLTQKEIAEIYEGTLTKWSQLVPGSANNKLACTGGSAEEESTIKPVVRLDKSGTTHIFKKFLAQVNETGKFQAEAFKGKIEEPRTWEEVSEGSENQRWPTEAHVTKPTENGNQGVVKTVAADASSLAYADLAVAREYEGGHFSSKGKHGGENTPGEANHEFWALVQNSPAGTEFADPSTDNDVTRKANSNCSKTVYIAKLGEHVPPPSTLSDWSKVEGSNTSETYPICGLTYDLAPQLYYPYLKKYGDSEATSKEIATSAHDYLHWMVNAKAGGGGPTLKNTDYEKISGAVQKEAELGAEEIGNTVK
jgi:ABC-type phosphate transport system substrate-binding protein